MRLRYERGADWVELERVDRFVSTGWSTGSLEHETFFDARAADEALAVKLDALTEAGWVESEVTRAARAAARAAEAEREARRLAHQLLAESSDPRGTVLEALGGWLERGDPEAEALLDEVGGFRVRLRGGGAMLVARHDGPLDALWLYPDAAQLEAGDHAVYFGEDAAPPEEPEEVGEVAWFLQEWPGDVYWFTRPDEPERAHAWHLDGGLVEDGRSRRAVLAERLLAALR
jgi:hypothetical protein